MTEPAVSDEVLRHAISLLGAGEHRATDIELGVARLVPDKLTARRLIDWIPEAFALVLIPHIDKVLLPNTFSARAGDGSWKQFPFEREPIFAQALTTGMTLYHDGPRELFSAVVKRSALLDTVNKALNDGASIAGAKLGGPAMMGIPAEFYEPKATKMSFWRKLIG